MIRPGGDDAEQPTVPIGDRHPEDSELRAECFRLKECRIGSAAGRVGHHARFGSFDDRSPPGAPGGLAAWPVACDTMSEAGQLSGGVNSWSPSEVRRQKTRCPMRIPAMSRAWRRTARCSPTVPRGDAELSGQIAGGGGVDLAPLLP